MNLFLLPVVPHVLRILVIFHDVDAFEAQKLRFFINIGEKHRISAFNIFAKSLRLSTNAVIQSQHFA